MFPQIVVEEMGPMAQAGCIIHEICHILCLHKQFAFFDRDEPTPEYQPSPIIVEGEGDKVTDIRVVLAEKRTAEQEGEANALATLFGFEEELREAFQFIERRQRNYV